MNTQKLNSAITEFIKKKKFNVAYYEEIGLKERNVKNTISPSRRTNLLQ